MTNTTRHQLRHVVAAAAVAGLALASCTSDREASSATTTTSPSGDGGRQAASADFGSLTDVCQPGDASGATAQGVTDEEIQVGVLTDFGFTQNREFIDTAEVFTAWCNERGGINGRQLTFEERDAKLFEYRQRIIQACQQDFALVGGGAAFENTGVRDRLQCGLPEIPAQTVSFENTLADLQVMPVPDNRDVGPYEGYYRWLVTEKYPETADAIGIIAGDVGVTRLISARETETLEFLGANVVYNDYYPSAGVTDWTPYAQALKSSGVKGLIFFGAFADLAKLEQALIDVGHLPAWIDTNTNAYNEQFIELAGEALDQIPNYAAPQIFPLEDADQNEATQELVDIFGQYAPDADITGPAVQGWSAWLLFASSARDCGSELTRRCLLDNAMANTAWDGGGLHAAYDLSDRSSTRACFVAVVASSSGWTIADFSPNEGGFRCHEHEYVLQGDYPAPMTLDDVGMTIEDIE